MEKHLAANQMKMSELRTLAGRSMCVATLLRAWGPFVSMLWGVDISAQRPLQAQARLPLD